MIPVSFRPMAEGDQGFVLNSWLKSLWRFNPSQQWQASRAWHAHWHAVLERLATPERVTVACSPENAWQIFGWACHAGPVLHFVCVKEIYRENGIARRLLEHVGSPRVCSFWTEEYADKLQHKFGWIYQPSKLRAA